MTCLRGVISRINSRFHEYPISGERVRGGFVTDSRSTPGRSHTPPAGVSLRIIVGTKPPQCRHREGASAAPSRLGKQGGSPGPAIGITRRFSRRASRSDPSHDARLVFPSRRGVKGLRRTADSIVSPSMRATHPQRGS